MSSHRCHQINRSLVVVRQVQPSQQRSCRVTASVSSVGHTGEIWRRGGEGVCLGQVRVGSLAGHRRGRTCNYDGHWTGYSCYKQVGRRSKLVTMASSEARELIAAGKVKYDSGDRMGALKLWEESMKKNPDIQETLTALFNSTCVHASFGDVELAQITLRDAVLQGLDFKQMLESPESFDEDAVNLVTSQQVLIRLKKFSEAAKKAASSEGPVTPRTKRSLKTKGLMNDDLTDVLETDMQGIDTSIFGIVKRVVWLLLALSVSGVVLWLVGLKYLFPEGN